MEADRGGIKKMFDSISVIIPAYNEERVIGSTLEKVTEYCAGKFLVYEVIVVDDCSKDKTREIVSSFPSPNVRAIHNEVNRGKGYSVKRGVLEAKNSLILFMDSDSCPPIENLGVLMPYLDAGFDIVIASRNSSGAQILNREKHRKFLSRGFSFIVGLVVLPGFSDTQCGFKLFKSAAAHEVFPLQAIDGFSFDVEVLFIAKKKGYRITEAPVKCVHAGKSSVSPFRDSIRMFMDIMRIRLNDLEGLYKGP